MLDRFPGREQAQAIEAPMLEPSEMFARFGERERSADERNVPMIVEIGRMVRAAVGIRHFAVAAQIDPAQDDAPALAVDEPASFDVE